MIVRPTDLHHAFRLVIDGVKGSRQKAPIRQAAAYARYGFKLHNATGRGDLTSFARTNAKHVRANLGGWRGEQAGVVRDYLDNLLEE